MPGRGTTFEVIGLPAMLADLAKTVPAIRIAVGAVNRETALSIRERAKALAPRRTGALSAAIVSDGRDLNWRVGLEDRAYPSRGGNTAHQNPWVYGVWYEFGFVTRKILRHSFMRPAADAAEAGYENRVADAVNEVLG